MSFPASSLGVAVYTQPTYLNSVASWLAMRKVKVRCLTVEEARLDAYLSDPGTLAYVVGREEPNGHWTPNNFMRVAPSVCSTLLDLKNGVSNASASEVALAIIVITHESGHLRNAWWSGSEKRTQCWAMRHIGFVFPKFGITDYVYQSVIMEQALIINASIPKRYRLKGCVLPTP